MSKELVVSANRHETRVALLDDDKLVEVSIERIAEHALAGSVYKGRVNRVLPGMQSAFVKVGLERDAFLYVSDVIDETADLEDGTLDDPEDALVAGGSSAMAEDSAEPEKKSRSRGDSPEPKSEEESGGERPAGRERRGRRSRRRRGRREDSLLPESKFAAVDETPAKPSKSDKPKPEEKVSEDDDDDYGLTLLPGESLAKYSGASKSEPQEEDDDETLATGATHLEDVFEEAASDDTDEDDSEDAENPDVDDEETDSEDESEDESGDGEDSEDEDSDDAEVEDADDAESADEDSDEEDEDDSEDDEEESDAGDDDSDEDDSDEDDSDEDDNSDNDEPENPDQEIEEDSGGEETVDEDNPSGLPKRHLFEPGTDPENLEASGESDSGGPSEAAVRDSRGERQLRRGRRGRRRGRRRGGRGDGERTPESQDAKPETAEAKTDGSHGQPGEPEPADGAEKSERSNKRAGKGRDDRSEKSGRSSRSDRSDRGAGNESDVRISDLLKAGQEIIVQIAKEPLGKKGARITTHIALPGRHLVYMPTSPHVGVSRKIGSDAERARLRKVIKANMEGIPGGFIVRTAGAGASDEDLADDMRFLANLWKTIQEKAERAPAPLLLHQDLDVVERILRDQLGQNFESIWVDSEEHYESIVRFVERFQPDLVGKVKLYTRTKPIFDEFNITQELEKALRPKVWLKSGGYLVINQTEALVAIDINTGKYVGKSDRLEDTIAKTNLEAVQEIVRQMRLRDLGGIIVVDFIDMDDKSNRKKVLQSLEKELRRDRAPSKVLQFNDFGLVAITRKRVKQSLERSLCSPCPACEGSGFVKSTTSVILDILEQARRLAPKMKGKKDLTLRVNPDVARALKARGNTFLPELEEVFGAHVLVRSDVSLHRENFDVN